MSDFFKGFSQAIFFLSVLMLSLCLSTANAQLRYPQPGAWEDKSDELPGMTSTGTILLVTVGTAAVVGGIYLLARKSKGDKNKNENGDEAQPNSDSQKDLSAFPSENSGSMGLEERLRQTRQSMPVDVILGVRRADVFFKDPGVVVGLSLSF